MCGWGDVTVLSVPIPADLSHTGEARIAEKGVDRCIAPIVAALNAGGIATRSSCCGHGRGPGTIALQDGRSLVIERPAGR